VLTEQEDAMNVLITGGTGALGVVVAERVSLAGHAVRLLRREAIDDARPSAYQRAAGDLASGAGIAAAVAGVDAVLHLASDPARPEVVDVDGTRRLAQAARDQGVRHMVYVSIVGVDVIPYRYYRCKRQAELILQEGHVPYSIVRATQFHGFVSGLLAALARCPVIMPIPAGFRVQPVDVNDVADCLVRSLSTGPSHRIAHFGGPEILRLGDMARTWIASMHHRRRVVSIPVPGRVARAFRAGGNVDADSERGLTTWAEWLRTRSSDDRTAVASS
jgi:uncharacterized protein YbjT (DUF2867 family)